MARYYFDVINDQGPMRDDDGQDLADADAIREVVGRAVLDLVQDEINDLPTVDIRVSVRDDTDSRIFSANLKYTTKWEDP